MGMVRFLLLASVSPWVKWGAGSGAVEFCNFYPLVSSPHLEKLGSREMKGRGRGEKEIERERKQVSPLKLEKGGVG